MLWAFLPVAVLVTITPGPATAMVVRSAMRGGWRAGVLTIAGNSIGVVAWALLSVLGIAALVAASLANPKLAVFFVALFPQFVDGRGAVVPVTLAMAAMIVAFDVVWYGALAAVAAGAKRGFARTRAARRLERATRAVLIALGARVALSSN